LSEKGQYGSLKLARMHRKIKHFNLDMIIAVGYRVNSQKATEFRQWATATLRDFL